MKPGQAMGLAQTPLLAEERLAAGSKMPVRHVAPTINDRPSMERGAISKRYRRRGERGDCDAGMQIVAAGRGQHLGKTFGGDAEIVPGKGAVHIRKADVIPLPAVSHQRGNPAMLFRSNVALVKRPGVIPARLTVSLKKQYAQRRL